MNTQEYLITLNVPPSLEEVVVDCLLTFEAEAGFSSFPIYAHDHRNEGLTIAEQVSGRQKKVRFQMYVPEASLEAFISKLKAELSGTDIHYWVLPIIAQGVI